MSGDDYFAAARVLDTVACTKVVDQTSSFNRELRLE
jgi:hypothetical protein